MGCFEDRNAHYRNLIAGSLRDETFFPRDNNLHSRNICRFGRHLDFQQHGGRNRPACG